jgi:Zn-finger nucleic acid-binding protein
MSEDTCPKCGGSALTTGKVFTHTFVARGWVGTENFFEPYGLQSRWFRLRSSVETPLVGGFQACLKCGLVWSHVSPEELRRIIEKQGTDEAKSRLPQ